MSVQGFATANYFSLSGKAPFKRLGYPVTESGGLGVHLRLDLNGRARFGPDVEWVSKTNDSVNPDRKESFIREISKFWCNFDQNRLAADYASIRAKVNSISGSSAFIISASDHNGIKGLVNLFGIESPGLTSSLAIAEKIAEIFNLDN
jgi:L-2-hydroxyglutarate oxidase LhgO